jgi:hypothetical protein
MPEYEIITKTMTERSYKLKLTLPVDMGSATNRITDKMIRTAATEKTLNLMDAETINEGLETEEEVTYIYRDNVQIWPRPRKKSDQLSDAKAFGKNLNRTSVPDTEDVAVEDAMSSDTEE